MDASVIIWLAYKYFGIPGAALVSGIGAAIVIVIAVKAIRSINH